MPEGVGYEVHEGGAPPSAGQIRDSGGNGVIWKRPDGSIFVAYSSTDFREPTPAQTEYANRPPAAEQEAALGGVGGAVPSAGVPAADSALQQGGQLGSGVTSAETSAAVPRSETMAQMHERKAREEASKGVATANYQKRVSEEGVYGGLSMGERGAAQQLLRDDPSLTEEDAAEMIRAERDRLGAADQAGALETTDPGTKGVPSP